MPAGIFIPHTPQAPTVGQSMSVGQEALLTAAAVNAGAVPGGGSGVGPIVVLLRRRRKRPLKGR